MPLSNDQFTAKLEMLGLDADKTPASQPATQSISDPNQADAPQGEQNPGIGYSGDPAQEKSALVAADPETMAAAQPPVKPAGPYASFQPSAQVASADPSDTGESEAPADSKPQTPSEQAEAKNHISSVISNPVVAQYIQNKYGPQADLNDVALKEAQEIASQKQLVAGIGQGLETIARAPSTTKVNTEFYKNLSDNANSDVKNILERRKAQAQETTDNINKLKLQEQTEDNDPNSAVAKELRKKYASTFKALGVDEDAIQNASPRVLKEYFQKMLDSANIAETRKAVAEINAEARRDAMRDRAEKGINDRVTKFSEALDPNKFRAGALADSQKRFNQSENLQGLVEKSAAGMNLDKRETEDFAIGLARMLSGSGQTSRAQIEALVPTSARGNANKMAEWLSNDPKGLDQQKFVQRMYATVLREKEVSRQQIQNAQMQRIAAYEDLPEDKRYDVMQNYGISPEMYHDFKKGRKSGTKTGIDFEKIPQQGHAPSKQNATPSAAAPAAQQAAPAKVRVSNGTETLEIDPSDLMDAQKDGYKQVQ